MEIRTIPYHSYEKGLPQEGYWIVGQKKGENILVYQAFNDRIADFAVHNQKFGGDAYSFSRMTWVKPNFLWMMYRSGWAGKENQNRILAIEMTFAGLEELLEEGVLTSYDQSFGNEPAWRERLNNSDVRVQWDPDHGPTGKPLKRRAVQIGIRNEALRKFNDQFIQSITDITGFVKEQKKRLDRNEECFFLMDENILEMKDGLKDKFSIPKSFISPFIRGLITRFEKTGNIDPKDFEKLLFDSNEKRSELDGYIKNYENAAFSRYLLKTAIAYRKGILGDCGCMCEDLLLFSYFVSKNKTTVDFDLIMEAKVTDFDTWCGFDGEMVFYTLGYRQTKEYLINNIGKFSKETVQHFLEFTEVYLYNDINSRAFWYL